MYKIKYIKSTFKNINPNTKNKNIFPLSTPRLFTSWVQEEKVVHRGVGEYKNLRYRKDRGKRIRYLCNFYSPGFLCLKGN